jgi:hypothetical protein
MNDNQKFLRNENDQKGMAEKAEENVDKMAVENNEEEDKTESQKPEDQNKQQ